MFCLQGGGVYIDGSDTQVDFRDCNIYQNTARYVSAHAVPGNILHRPHGRTSVINASVTVESPDDTDTIMELRELCSSAPFMPAL